MCPPERKNLNFFEFSNFSTFLLFSVEETSVPTKKPAQRRQPSRTPKRPIEKSDDVSKPPKRRATDQKKLEKLECVTLFDDTNLSLVKY